MRAGSGLWCAALCLTASLLSAPLAAATVNPVNLERAAVPAARLAATSVGANPAVSAEPVAPGPSAPPAAELEPGEVREDRAAEGAIAEVQEPARPWLRQAASSKVQAEPEAKGGFPYGALALVLIAALVGAAFFLRKRRGRPLPWTPTGPVRVASTTRLGPKASLVTVEVYGRMLLLGVTEETVSELGWVDAQLDADVEQDTTHSRLASDEPPSRSRFQHVLNNVFGSDEVPHRERTFRGNPDVAALIAARETKDVVHTSSSRANGASAVRLGGTSRTVNEAAPRVETQVAGLMRRRR